MTDGSENTAGVTSIFLAFYWMAKTTEWTRKYRRHYPPVEMHASSEQNTFNVSRYKTICHANSWIIFANMASIDHIKEGQ